MNCPNCGNPQPDGTQFCGICGTPLQQAGGQQFQQQYQQPEQQYQQQYQQPGQQYQQQPGQQYQQQPAQQYQQQPGQQFQQQYQQPGQQYQQQPGMQPGYMPVQQPKMVRVPKYVKPSILRMIGSVLIFIPTIVPIWFGQGYGGGYAGAGFFVSGGGILALWGVLLMLTAVAMMILEVDVNAFRQLQGKFNAFPYARFYLPGFALFLLLMGTFAHSAGTHDIGWGWWLCLIGILLSCVAPVMDIIKGNK